MSKIEQINNLISSQYSNKKYSELKALSKLFSIKFLTNLEKILNDGLRNESHFREKIDVSVGWIDKIPMASFTNEVENGNFTIDERVELGDFLLVYNHFERGISQEKEYRRDHDNRAIIIQAKLSNKEEPCVPIAKMEERRLCSTRKQLALLSEWPTFSLFKASRSEEAILSNIDLDKSQSNRKFAGYYNKNWYLGKAKLDETCNQSMGELIIKMTNREEGQCFKNDDKKDHWSLLINTVIKLCGEYKLPNSLFGKQRNRYVFIDKLFSNPIVLFFFLFKKKKFPVLVITKIDYEG